MKMSVPAASIGQASVQQVQVGEVRIGPVHVGTLRLNDLQLQAGSGVAQLRNVRVVLAMAFALDWQVGIVIDAPWPLPDVDFTEKGTMNLGTMQLAIGFGNLTLPGLADLQLDIPKLVVPDVTAVVGALKQLSLGAVLAERIQAQGVVAPGGGLQLDGLGLGGVAVQGLQVPAASLAGVRIGRVAGGGLPLKSVTMPGFALPQVQLPRVSCSDVGAIANPVVTTMPTADVGLLQATLKVTTTAAFHVDELRIDGVRASTSIGEIALQDVELPYEVLDLTLSQLGIDRIEIPQTEVH
ncbi:hypothetical protein ACPOLB_22635 [Rubrivivax sp. RP6-9]|uniref:hypothetical protein n=1 Tax=Rubrivivax sp. RP6-9 TaxID=3415750 RepID=UPI003CC596F1